MVRVGKLARHEVTYVRHAYCEKGKHIQISLLIISWISWAQWDGHAHSASPTPAVPCRQLTPYRCSSESTLELWDYLGVLLVNDFMCC